MSATLFHLQEEKEKRLEEMFESAFDDTNESRHAPQEEIPEGGAVGLAGKKTQETLTATDLIIDALDMAEAEAKRLDQHKVSNMPFFIYFFFHYFSPSLHVHFFAVNILHISLHMVHFFFFFCLFLRTNLVYMIVGSKIQNPI